MDTPAPHPFRAPSADDAEAWLRLALAGGAAEPRRLLLEATGGPRAALAAGEAAWRAAGLSPAQCGALVRPDPAALARGRAWCDGGGHHVVGWGHPGYPPLLCHAASPPVVLFLAGEPGVLLQPMIAIVGSRAATPGGRDNARAFAAAFARAGLAVASGLAAGIDAAAHRAALDAGAHTVAVVGTGPDVVYPPRHAGLQAEVEAYGAVISEHPPGTPARAPQFPARNRILAALAAGTVVIEAAWRSGALITARLAAEAGREVFALPGSIHNPMARGCHRLIREGVALVETPQEVLEALGPTVCQAAGGLRRALGAPIPHAAAQQRLVPSGPGHPGNYDRLWQALGHDPTDMDQLVARTGLTVPDLSPMLLGMELQGLVAHAHGRWTRTSPPPHGAPPGAGQET